MNPRRYVSWLLVLLAPVWRCSSCLTASAATTPWSFARVVDPPLPTVRDSAWVKSSVDAFILAKLEERGLRPAGPADRRTLLRRVTFDLTGLPPTPEELEAFLADDSSRAFERVVDRLLASPHYGERWGRHWLDVVRYADTAGDTADYPVGLAWKYRNYVIAAFNSDKPYDVFVQEQVAGDILADADAGADSKYAERVTATGYVALSRRFGFDSENYQHLTIQDTLDTLGQSVLGLTLGCARCHDHKYDPVTMSEYYALYGIFDSTRYAFPGSEQKGKSRAMVPLVRREVSTGRWRAHAKRAAGLAAELARNGKTAPASIYRSLHDPDGDFEMQKEAAGGSYGVLVAPWLWEGDLSARTTAQSPFTNWFPSGRVGAFVAGGARDYLLAQAIQPGWWPEKSQDACVSFDFRVLPTGATHETGPPAMHRFWVGTGAGKASAEVFLSTDAVHVRSGEGFRPLGALATNGWHRLVLVLGRGREGKGFECFLERDGVRVWSGIGEGSPGGRADWQHLQWDSRIRANGILPALAVDNVEVSHRSYDWRVFDSPAEPERSVGEIQARLRELAGAGGDFEGQTSGEVAELRTALAAAEARAKGQAAELTRLLEEGPCEMAYAVAEGTPHDARLHRRGEPDRPGDVVPRGFIRALGGGPLPAGTRGSGRLELARWLTDRTNPLTARVMANRIWQHHFGRGLVATPNDFGSRGERPTHPELLDHLATRFMAGGWSVKALHRLILLGSTYRQATGESRAATDWFAGQARRRLSAEELRDTLLSVSGRLEGAPATGHPFPSPVQASFSQHGPFQGVYEHGRRSVYLMTQRLKRHPFLALFDGPDPNSSTATRATTTVPTQSLFFLNDPFVHDQSWRCAERLEAAAAAESARIDQAWRWTVGREPTTAERDDGAAFLAAYREELAGLGRPDGGTVALAAYVRTLFGSNEFLHLD